MPKKKTLMIRAVGNRNALSSYRRMMVRNALRKMYECNDLSTLYQCEAIIQKEIRKASFENYLRLTQIKHKWERSKQ